MTLKILWLIRNLNIVYYPSSGVPIIFFWLIFNENENHQPYLGKKSKSNCCFSVERTLWFFSQGNFRTHSLLPVIFFFTPISKWVAVLEIPENMNKYATKNMSFNLSENSCPSDVFKNIFLSKLQEQKNKFYVLNH